MAGLSKFSRLRASVLFRSFRAPFVAVPSHSILPSKPFHGLCKTVCTSSTFAGFGLRSFHGLNETKMKQKEWTCTGCNFINVDRNERCRRCGAALQNMVTVTVKDEKKEEIGTWICQCRFVNLAIEMRCLRCGMPEAVSNPDINLQPRDCQCAMCLSFNTRREMVCLRCYNAAATHFPWGDCDAWSD